MTKTGFAFRRVTAASILLLGVSLSACSDDDNDDGGGGPPAATDYAGFVASTVGQTGPLSIVFASPVAAPPAGSAGATGPNFSSGAPVAATGTVSLGGGPPVAITGTIDGGTLNMTGAGGWILTGSLLNGMIVGTFTAADGSTGSLSAVASAEGSPAQVYCGYYGAIDLTNETEVTGSFSLVIAGNIVLGTAVDADNEDPIDFTGTANQGAGTFEVDMSADGGRLVVDGSFDETGASGTFDTYFGSVHVQTGDFYGYTDCTPT